MLAEGRPSPPEDGEVGASGRGWGRAGFGERQMQFIVIYGTRFIYGGQRLPRDWEGAGRGGWELASGLWPGRMPIVGAEGSGPSWASLPLPGPLALRLWLLL